jgi:drug/metabolite transporter (DMT)-like permease
MLTVIVGLSSALVFGAADFLGGLSSKRIGALLATPIAAVTGLVALGLVYLTLGRLLPILGGEWSTEAVLLGALSGVAGAAAIGLLYACLAIGPMSILSPLTAVVSAIVPLTVGLARGERLGPIGYVALGIALVAVVLVGFVPEKGAVRPSLKGVLMAIGSGIAIGAFLIIIDATPDESGVVPLIVNRATNAAVMFAVLGVVTVVAMRRGVERRPIVRRGIQLAIACGVVDVAANVGLLVGVRIGELSIMSVLTAMYPAGTIILAAVVLKERIAVVQYVGLALAIAAGAMLALV